MSDKLGGKQIGTMVQVLGWKGGGCILHSVSDQKAGTLGNIIKEHVPRETPIFTDEGYTWLEGIYRNHRMVNHSLKSKDKRWVMSGERWSRLGVNCQVSEGLNGSRKTAFKTYRYVRPEYSQLYLNEWAFFKNFSVLGGFEALQVESRDAFWKVRRTQTGPSGDMTGACVATDEGITQRASCPIHTEALIQHHPRLP